MSFANLESLQGDRNLLRERILFLVLVATCSVAAIGCSMLGEASSDAAPTPSTSPAITIRTALPSAMVGKVYSTVLVVSGGHSPYIFLVSSGQLPPGMALNPRTGNLVGIPTHAGDFVFTVMVTSNSPSAKGTRPYKLSVESCTTCSAVSVDVTPANPSIAAGGHVQFAATVSNTSNTAVTWSASAGSISSNGLFTAPQTNSAETITITAKSAAQPSAAATASVKVSAAATVPLTVSTATIPGAVHGNSYTTSLDASGGKPPYQWSLVSGTLPGLSLASGGAISGSATKTGNFPFSVKVTDSASNSAQQSLTLDVTSPSGGFNCGPPTYNCSRTDMKPVQITKVPNMGGLTGMNTTGTDPDFSNAFVRVTDWKTDSSIPTDFRSFVSAGSGSADENLFNLDSTMFVVQSLGNATYPYLFDAKDMKVSRMYVSQNSSSGGLKLPDAGEWSRVDPNILYTPDSNGKILKYDFSDQQHTPSPQLVYDLNSGNCIPSGYNISWKSKGGVSMGDTVFGMAYSNSGGQGTGSLVVAYKVGSGCTTLDTKTGKITGDWGSTGTMNRADRWLIHNVKMSKDGNWLIIAPQSCLISNCSSGPFFWEIGTLNVTSCGDGRKCGGHWTEGYSHWVNNYLTANQIMRPLPEVSSIAELTRSLPQGIRAPLDEHLSWNNADPSDSVPFLITTVSTISPFPTAFYNEIMGISSDGSGKFWRFAHSFISAQSPIFDAANGIGSVSQDGKWFIFSSDWMGTLGSQSGGTTCKVRTNCRSDVFIVQLN